MYKTVDGMYDYLPLESYSLHKLGDNLLKEYQTRGFKRIDTPTLERYELFEDSGASVARERLFKLVDGDGSILVLRPDMTMPIARVAVSKLNEPNYNKFCYLGNSYCFKPNGNDIREFAQAGVEVFAPQSTYVDADVIAMAISSLRASGLRDFQVDIGHVGYFKGILEELDLDEIAKAELTALVNVKDTFGIELFAHKYSASKGVIDAILALPMMFGGAEILEDACLQSVSATSRKAIEDLIQLNSYLEDFGLSDFVSYDLSLVNGISYYTGIVFKGISRHFAASILAGGRYDKLCDSLGKHLDATGFAIGVNNLLIACRRENGSYLNQPTIDIYVGGAFSRSRDIMSFINIRTADGAMVENSYICDLEQFEKSLAKTKATMGVFFDADGGVKEVCNG